MKEFLEGISQNILVETIYFHQNLSAFFLKIYRENRPTLL